jgi:hypothetical protein
MNYNDKEKNDKIELDELNIKSHLNTSLDLSGISVSEDLINRTLAAIKEQSLSGKDEVTQTSIMEPTKKIIAWNRYIRGFAGVAAAVVIVAVGYNLVQRMPFGMKQSSDSAAPELAVTMDNATESATSQGTTGEENQTFDASAVEEKKDEILYTITAETGALEDESPDTDNGTGLSGSTGAEETVPPAENANLKSADRNMTQTQEFAAETPSTDNVVTYTFREIFLPTPEQAEYITISDNRSDASITLTQPDDIDAFYVIMDSYQYSSTGTDSMIEPNYTVEMNSPELGALYTMLIGRNLTVRYTQGESTVENIYYVVDDTEFKQGLEEFFVERSE